MLNNTNGIRNVALGQSALESNQAGNNNVVVGVRALQNSNHENANNNIAIGYLALNSAVLGKENVAVGTQALRQYIPTSTDVGMTAVGHEAMAALVNGTSCTSLGWESLYGMTTNRMENTTAVGARALRGFTAENFRNTGIGAGCGTVTTGGDDNVYVGFNSGYSCATSDKNSFIGAFSGMHVDGSENVFVGYAAGGIPSTIFNGTDKPGSNNVFLGVYAGGTTSPTGSMPRDGNVMLGNYAGFEQNVNNQLWIDNSANNTPLIWGDFTNRRVGVDRQNTTNAFEVNGDASKASAGNWLANSDKRLKTNFRELNSEETLEKILRIKGTTFEWNDNVTTYKNVRPTGRQYGLIAQDILAQFPDLVQEDELGYLMTSYGTFDPLFIEALRALNDKIEHLENELEKLMNPVTYDSLNDPLQSQSVELSNMRSTILNQNSPNPFAQQTIITFVIPQTISKAMIVFHSAGGALINEIEIDQRENGSLVVYSEDLSSGIYTYSLILDGVIYETKRMIKTN